MDIKTANTILYCKRWKETVAFYKIKLGLQVTTSREWFVEFKLNEASRLSIADESRASIDSNEGKGITITFEVIDIKMAHSYLKEVGLNPPPIKDHPWGAKVFRIYDPEGNRIEFWSKNMI
jgi:catechol 2,3-dioxygenase-like lactoylglutathione lyase family enzyme